MYDYQRNYAVGPRTRIGVLSGPIIRLNNHTLLRLAVRSGEEGGASSILEHFADTLTSAGRAL